jgi:hypothetical protein
MKPVGRNTAQGVLDVADTMLSVVDVISLRLAPAFTGY